MASNEETPRKCKVEACVFTRCGLACEDLCMISLSASVSLYNLL